MTQSYRGRIECSCRSTTAFYICILLYFREEFVIQVQSNSVITSLKGLNVFYLNRRVLLLRSNSEELTGDHKICVYDAIEEVSHKPMLLYSGSTGHVK